MNHSRITQPLAKALRFYAVLAVAIVIFQGIGLLMYLVNVWPTARLMGPGGEPISTGVTVVLFAAVVMGFVRSFVWIKIYWNGSKALSLLKSEGESQEMADRLTPVLASARVVFPQAFGFAALILAFLTHQYGQLLKESGRMKNELELTI
jgi:hypothetical protein